MVPTTTMSPIATDHLLPEQCATGVIPSRRNVIGQMMCRLGMLLTVFGVSGCMTTQTAVTNPIPGLSSVAVAPFFNLSDERSVDGRRFANIYSSELQKVPGYDVVPVGVTEQAMQDHNLQMSRPADAIRLAEILGVDLVVVGAVTDYSPYDPPRVGMKTVWHARELAPFQPGLPIIPVEEETVRGMIWKGLKTRMPELAIPIPGPLLPAEHPSEKCDPDTSTPVIRGQSMTSLASVEEVPPPIMDYSRMFDGADSATAAALRDYVELRGDVRAGGWEAYLSRSDDYIRFCCNRMIVEMLTLHGGQGRIRTVLKWRKEK